MPEKKSTPIEKSNRDILINGKLYSDFTVGSDPEFSFKGVAASTLGMKFEDKFGLDGHSHISELRPTPQYCPINLTKTIEDTMRGGFRDHPKVRDKIWLAGSCQEGHPLGGHIHFGSSNKEGMDIKIDGLNKLLAPTILMVENGEKAKERRQGSYGTILKTGRCFDKHDEYGGFEYRPLPSWLVSRNFCAATLSLAKVIMFEAHNPSLRPGLMARLKFIKQDKEFENNFMTCNKIFFIRKIPTIYRIVSKLTLFPKYERYINYLFNYIYQGRTWEDDTDIKPRWNIVPTTPIVDKIKEIGIIKVNRLWDSANAGSRIPF